MAKISLTDVQVRRLIEATSFPPRGMSVHELRLRLSDCTNAFLGNYYFQSRPKPPPSHAVKRFGGIRTRARELRDAMPRTDVIDPELFDAVHQLYQDVEAIADRMGLRILPVQTEIPASQDEIDSPYSGKSTSEMRRDALDKLAY